MANYKTKQKDLKNISGKTDTGGAPLFANDFVRLQQNAKADAINFQEGLRRRLGNMAYYRGSNPAEEMHSFGIILAGCTYDNSTSGSVTLSEGYILSEGEICYFPGATYSASPITLSVFYLRKGALLTESRVFSDGANKEFLVEREVEVFQTTWLGFSPSPEPLATADLTKEYVVITAGANQTGPNANFTERRCTIDAALNVTKIGEENNYLAFQDATLATGVTLLGGVVKFGSKINQDGSTFISGGIRKYFGGASNLSFVVATLLNYNVNSGKIFFSVTALSDESTPRPYVFPASVNSSGEIEVYRTGNTIWTSGSLNFHFNNTIIGNTSAYNKSFTYNDKFLDVTP